MSEPKERNEKYIGKIRNVNTTFGQMQKICLDANPQTNEDGTPNKYYAGTLIFVATDGTMYKVKQMSIKVPKNGMNANLVEKGFVANVTLDLNNTYDVEPAE